MSNSFGCMYLFIELICLFQTSKDISVSANDLFFISKLKYDKFYYCWYIKGCKTPYSHTANRNTVKSGSNNSIFDTARFVDPCEAELIWKCPKKCPTSVLTQGIKANLLLSYPTTHRSRNSQCIIKKKKEKKKKESVQHSQSDDVLFRGGLCGWWWRAGSSFSLLVEMADERPRARQGCQFSLSKSCVALECLEGERRDKDKS